MRPPSSFGLAAGACLLLLQTALTGGQTTGAQTSAGVVGHEFSYVVDRGDTWRSLGSRHGVEPGVLAESNGLLLKDPPKVGDVLRIDNRHIVPKRLRSGIVINIPQRMLFFTQEDESVVEYPVSLGRPDWPTFIGAFTVVAPEVDPVWDVPPSIQEEMRRAGKRVLTKVGPGPTNPLGKYWLGLSAANYGIHGTIAPLSIYRFETHGCIRLHPDDIADLWPRVRAGTPGEILYEPIVLWIDPDGPILLEAHRDIYRRDRSDPLATIRARVQSRGVEPRVDWEKVNATLAARTGQVVDVSRPSTTAP